MRFPAFMFWPERYWLDAYDLSDAEHGIYLQLLIHTWNTPTCRLPNDSAWIGRKMGRSAEAVESQVKPIMRRFYQCDGNTWFQPKLLEEFGYLGRLRNRQSGNANKRWAKEKGVSHGNANGNAKPDATLRRVAMPPHPHKSLDQEERTLTGENRETETASQ